jgi:hypothetical protein
MRHLLDSNKKKAFILLLVPATKNVRERTKSWFGFTRWYERKMEVGLDGLLKSLSNNPKDLRW